MAIYEITADQIRKIPETTYSLAGVREVKEFCCVGIMNLGAVAEFS